MGKPARPGKGDDLARGGGGRGRGGGGGRGGRGPQGRSGKGDAAAGGGIANKLAELDDRSIEHESNIEILRAQRAAARCGRTPVQDHVRENEGVDEDDPLISIDDGIRIEPFNMRREMAEGHFDESGFYVMNKEEEKEVTDAWLDTIDKAQKTAAFKKAEALKKASDTATSRLSKLSKNLGKDGEEAEEDEEDAEKKEGETVEEGEQPAEAVPDAAAKAPAAVDSSEASEASKTIPPQDEAKEEEQEVIDIVATLEELINELGQLETPAEALRRWRKASGPAVAEAGATSGFTSSSTVGRQHGAEPLKMRSRVRKAKAEAAAVAAAAAEAAKEAASAKAGAGKRKILNEFGFYEAKSEDVATTKVARSIMADESNGRDSDVGAPTGAASSAAVAPAVAGEPAQASSAASVANGETPGAGEANVGGEAFAGTAANSNGKAVGTDSSNSASGEAFAASAVADAASVAAAAEKAAAEEKARKEAAEAAAADARISKLVLHADLDKKGNPEFDAVVNLNADDQKMKDAAAVAGGAEADGSALPSRKRKTEANELELQRRAKIERLTDLCDRLLERGVLVYDSTREQLSIEVRERRGEQILADDADEDAVGAALGGTAEGGSSGSTAGANSASTSSSTNPDAANNDAAQQTHEVIYVNRRLGAESKGAGDGGNALLGLLQEGGGEASNGAPEDSAQGPLLWQYRWSGNPTQVHGPFDSVTMQGWVNVSAFAEERPAEVRQCDANNTPTESCWHKWDTIDFTLYI